MAVEIIPAVLPASFAELEHKAELAAGFARTLQVDVVDGVYAKTSGWWRCNTWPYRDRASFERIVQDEKGLPHWERLDYQFDLMIAEPLAEAARYIRAGATQVVLHAKASHAFETLQQIVDSREDVSGTYPVRIGVAIGPDEQPESLEPFEAQFDFVQVMGIARIGRQGQPFEPKTLHLLERLRQRYPTLPLQVDGGVHKETVPRLVAAGATRLVAGSAIFGADDPAVAYRELSELANAHR